MLAPEDQDLLGLARPGRFAPRPSTVSQVLRAIREEAELGAGTSGLGHTEGSDCPDFSCAGCSFGIAASMEDRRRVWSLAFQIYREMGYATNDSSGLWYGLHDALPQTVTFFARRDERVVAALTLVFDSPLQLPADEIYAEEMEHLRAAGRRPCELVSLVSEEKDLRVGVELIKHLFKLAYLTAWRLERASDFVITVNPRHVPFYERMLLFERLGAERSCAKVSGAPAVALRLNLETAEARYRARYAGSMGERSLLRFFVNEREPGILAWIRAHRRPLDRISLRRHFVSERPLLPDAARMHRDYIEEQFPACAMAAD